MNKPLLDHIIAQLLPHMDNARDRKALVSKALYGCPVLNNIEWNGSVNPFTFELVTLLDKYGEIETGKPALVTLLQEARSQVGLNHRTDIDICINELYPSSARSLDANSTSLPSEPYVFMSYSRKDTVFVDRLESGLKAKGIIVWRDVSSIPGGGDWYKRVGIGLKGAYAVVCIVTPNADESEWARLEQTHANENGVPLLAVLPAKHRNPLHLTEIQSIMMEDPHFDTGLSKLVEALGRCKGQQTRSPRLPRSREIPFTETDTIQEYLKWVLSEKKADLRDARYVDLAATPERSPEPHIPFKKSSLSSGLDDDFVFSSVQLEKLTHDDFEKKGEDVPDARIAVRDLHRSVLLGDPGAGKTTTLLKIVVDMARDAQNNPPALLPIFVPLSKFDGTVSFLEFVKSNAKNLQSDFEALLTSGRFMLLCDSLNEMPRHGYDGRDLVTEVREFLRGQSDWLVSCRVRDYTDDLSRSPDGITGIGKIRLKPLDPPRIKEFIQNKFATLGQPELSDALWEAMGGSQNLIVAWEAFVRIGSSDAFWGKKWLPGNPSFDSEAYVAWQAMGKDHRHLLPICRNPYMANMVAALYSISKKLPENRAGLFSDFVTNLLRHEQKRLQEIGVPWLGDSLIRDSMGEIAWNMGAQTDMTRADAETLIRARFSNYDPAILIAAAASAGLIEYNSTVRFTHQLIQQYFASAVLGARMDAGLDPTFIWKPDNWWLSTGREETAILLAGDRNDPQAIARWLASAQPEFAVELLKQPDFAFDLADLDSETKKKIIDSASAKKSEKHPVGRAAAFRVFGLLNSDRRPGVGLRQDGLPDIEWSQIIPAGTYTIGSDDGIINSLNKQNIVIRQPFQVSKYLITQLQFQAFIDSTNRRYDDPEWWNGLAATKYEKRLYEPYFKFSNHPLENINWFQAVAFCRWLTWCYQQAGLLAEDQAVRLPHEHEWEVAARGIAALQYPYGNVFDETKSNTHETGIGQTSAVGIFPEGASPYGILDMSGHVWEWCLNRYKGTENETSIHQRFGALMRWILRRDEYNGNSKRVLRGGAWLYTRSYARSTSRYGYHPGYRDDTCGFRVVRSSF